MGNSVGILGAGKIGEAIARGIAEHGLATPDQILLSVKSEQHRQDLAARSGMRTFTDNGAVARGADTLILSVKPKTVGELIDEIAVHLTPGKLLISTAAGVSLDFLESRVPAGTPVIRTMPNMAVGIGDGMTVLSPGRAVRPEQLEWATALFRALGRAMVLEEQHMDAVTGLSGSGPAFVYIIIESFADGGVKLGLPREVATELAAQTVLGAARTVLVTGEHPAKLKDQVTTPAGVTIDGILELEAGRLRVTLINAVVKAAERARQLLHRSH
ncbi:MAG TPA: pyrroline-5-carboxylate reductase [Rectinemataceae bacterium]|nr:pyrroline-5-carboxylate reductase [Rectinemataceae bacterium]